MLGSEARVQYLWEPDRFAELAASVAYIVAYPDSMSRRDRPMIECVRFFVADARYAQNLIREGQEPEHRLLDAYKIASLGCMGGDLEKHLSSSANVLSALRKSAIHQWSLSEGDRAERFFISIAISLAPKQ